MYIFLLTISHLNSYQCQYAGNKTTTYWYYCSQRDNLTKKLRKHSDPLKQRDVLSKERYNCDGVTKGPAYY